MVKHIISVFAYKLLWEYNDPCQPERHTSRRGTNTG